MQNEDFQASINTELPAIFSLIESLSQLMVVISELKEKWESLLDEINLSHHALLTAIVYQDELTES